MVVRTKNPRHTPNKGQTHVEPASGKPNDLEELVVMLNKVTHEPLGVARLDGSGQRQMLSDEECLALVGAEEVDEAVRGADEAFEAGLAEGLGVEDDEDDDDGDVLLARLLLRYSAERSLQRRDLHRALVRRLLLRRLLRNRLAHHPPATEQRREPIGHHARNGSDTREPS